MMKELNNCNDILNDITHILEVNLSWIPEGFSFFGSWED